MATYTSTTLVGSNQKLTLSAGDSAYYTTVANSASLMIQSGGIADEVYLQYLGSMTVSAGGTATKVNADNMGKINAVVGGADNTTLISGSHSNGAEFSLVSNTASNFILYAKSWQIVSNGGITRDITVNNSGQLFLSSGASATGIIHNNGGIIFYAPLRGDDSATLVSGSNPYGEFGISNGSASGLMLCGHCNLPVSNGGMVYGAVVNGLQAKLQIHSGGTAERTSVARGAFEIYSGGFVSDTVVISSAMTVCTGATAKDTVVSGGTLYTSAQQSDSGDEQESTSSGAVVSPAVLDGLTVGRNAALRLQTETAFSGTITIGGTATIGAAATMSDGAALVLDIAERNSEAAAIISDFSKFEGDSYTISVSVGAVDQYGIYKLAAKAADFDTVITVTCAGSELGTLGVGDDFTIPEAEANYSLALDSEILVLTIADTAAPVLDGDPEATVLGYTATITWNPAYDKSGIKKYVLAINEEEYDVNDTSYVLSPAAIGDYVCRLKAVDIFDNESEWSNIVNFEVVDITPQDLEFSDTAISWTPSKNISSYATVLSADGFDTVLEFNVAATDEQVAAGLIGIDIYNLGVGNYRFKARADIDPTYAEVAHDIIEEETGAVKFSAGEGDGHSDVFFAQSDETWGSGYRARHVGTAGWQPGTREIVALNGKNRISNLFYGAEGDASLLCLTDTENGDVLALDDAFSALPDGETSPIARFQRIKEIRAGAGDDVVDLTSLDFTAPGVTIRGGDGDDVLWSGDGQNRIFGDAGNDRLVGGAGNDVLCGGSGDDRMHGGGGSDIFTFSGNWGKDVVETTADGDIVLWFSGIGEGDVSLSYKAGNTVVSCGQNSITVMNRQLNGDALRFGDSDYADQFAELEAMGAFLDCSSVRIFDEEYSKGVIASL